MKSENSDEFEEIPEEDIDDLKEFARDYFHFDFNNYHKECLSNTNVNIAVTPLKRDGEPLYFPHRKNSRFENAKLENYWLKTHGYQRGGWEAETCYSFDLLKVMGRLDLQEVYKKLCEGYVLDRVQLHARLVSHNSHNGSGGLTDLPNSKSQHWYKAQFRIDELDRYGIDAVFGFCRSQWDSEIAVKYKKKREK